MNSQIEETLYSSLITTINILIDVLDSIHSNPTSQEIDSTVRLVCPKSDYEVKHPERR